MDVQDLGIINDGVTYRDVVDWPVGITVVRPRAVAACCITAQNGACEMAFDGNQLFKDAAVTADGNSTACSLDPVV